MSDLSNPTGGYLHNHLIRIEQTYACSGDSGGPWHQVDANTAAGIHHGGSAFVNPDCATYAYATPMNVPLQALAPYSPALYAG